MKALGLFAGLFALVGLVACARPQPLETPPPASGGPEGPETVERAPAPDKPPHARRVIYQLVVRTFGNVNPTRAIDGTIDQNGVGKFNDINDRALAGLKALGATDVWLTGVLRQATLTDHSDIGLPPDDPDVVKGRAGSFFAVRDAFDVSPDYAVDRAKRLDEFDALVARIHAAGMKVVIDLVPNHVARGYASVVRPDLSFGAGDDPSAFFAPSNHLFYLPGQGPLRLSKPAHWTPAGVVFDGQFAREDASSPERTPRVTGLDGTSVSPSADEWYETVKLNYGVDFTTGEKRFEPTPRTWQVMDELVAHWQARGVDGFRCDFAHVVPNEAWSYLITRARERNPAVFFFAEAYAPLHELIALQRAGFDAVYHDPAVDELKRIYQGKSSQAQFAEVMGALDDDARPRFLHYLENHDERRVASPIVVSDDPNGTGFGGAAANYQLAPLLYLYGNGPVLVFNGQEVGEPGAGREGFSGDDGRTTLFDYWSSPELAKWVSGHQYDGAGLSGEQRQLRAFLSALLSLAKEPLASSTGYWGLEYFNNPQRFGDSPDALYSFARFERDGGALLLVAANFAPGAETTGVLRIPSELFLAAGLPEHVTVTLRLDRTGARQDLVATLPRAELATTGLRVTLPDQTALVWEIH